MLRLIILIVEEARRTIMEIADFLQRNIRSVVNVTRFQHHLEVLF